MDADNSYFAGWYEKNGSALNSDRRTRYATDAQYREKILKRNQKARRFRSAKRRAEEKLVAASKKLAPTGTWKTLTVEMDVGGRKVETTMFTIGALAKAIGRGISTVRVWEKQGLLPETPHRSPRGDRIYTLDQVQGIQRELRKMGKLGDQKLNVRRKPDAVTRTVRFATGEERRISLFRVGALASAMDRTVIAVTQMEKAGRIPRSPLLASALNYRLYTVEMIAVVRVAFHRRFGIVRGNEEWAELYREIEHGWGKLGMTGALVLDEKKDGENATDEVDGGHGRTDGAGEGTGRSDEAGGGSSIG